MKTELFFAILVQKEKMKVENIFRIGWIIVNCFNISFDTSSSDVTLITCKKMVQKSTLYYSRLKLEVHIYF